MTSILKNYLIQESLPLTFLFPFLLPWGGQEGGWESPTQPWLVGGMSSFLPNPSWGPSLPTDPSTQKEGILSPACPDALWDRYPPVNRLTHACENITFPRTTYVVVARPRYTCPNWSVCVKTCGRLQIMESNNDSKRQAMEVSCTLWWLGFFQIY